jgi:hypothetical protein
VAKYDGHDKVGVLAHPARLLQLLADHPLANVVLLANKVQVDEPVPSVDRGQLRSWRIRTDKKSKSQITILLKTNILIKSGTVFHSHLSGAVAPGCSGGQRVL